MPERPKFDSQTLKRLLSYMRAYKGTLVLVTVCILLSAVAGAASSMFLQKLIDGYIVPMLGTASPDYSGLIRALITIGCVYLVGTLATWLYNRRMVTIAQGTLKRIRDEMFEKMQRLPIRYFDTHTHGDIMSLYTNDTDTLRQMIAQSMAQLVSSVFTLAAVFFCMLYISIWLTLIVCAVMALILMFVRKLTGRIGGYFMAQQTALADLNGYVEEMVNGQKVVKVFCHEEQSKAELHRRNRVWAENAARASGMANSMMPMMNAVGYLQYVIIAVIGGTMAIAGTPNLSLTGMNTLTLGMIASFLTLSRGFTNPISQISNQFNSIVTALAGASRIFAFMDAEPETDDGYVTLVNAKEENGTLAEADHHTGLWAWKHPHGDGTVTYTKLAGRVVFDHVDFGYTPEQIKEMQNFFKNNDFTANFSLQHEITLTGAKAEVFNKAKYAFTKYWLDNLPVLGIKRQMKNFAKEYPIKLLQDTDGIYFSEQVAEIYNDPKMFEAAVSQFADMYGEQIYAGCEAYAKSVGKEVEDLTDEEISFVVDKTANVLDEELIKVLMLSQQVPEVFGVSQKVQ